jgi:hypothetical protein
MFVVRVGLGQYRHHRVQIGQVGELGFVQRLEQAAFDLWLGKHHAGTTMS